MVDLDEHVPRHHGPDQVAPERGQAPRVALPVRRIRGHALVRDRLGAREEARQHLELALGQRADLLALARLGARGGGEPRTRLQPVEDVDEGALRIGLERGARERVVDPVRHEHRAHAEAPELVEPAIDLGGRARRRAHGLAAAERVRRLDADDRGELAPSDDATGLRGAEDEAEPAAPRPVALAVDVPLKRPQGADLQPDRHWARCTSASGPARCGKTARPPPSGPPRAAGRPSTRAAARRSRSAGGSSCRTSASPQTSATRACRASRKAVPSAAGCR